jgi:MFS family permease
LNDTGEISVGLIYLIVAAIAATESFNNPAWQSIIPNLVPREHLMNALSLNSVMAQTAKIIGPALAGFAIAWKGVASVYVINVVSFFAVLAAIIRMKTPTQKSPGASRVNLAAMGEGIRFVLKSQILLSTALLDFFSVFFSSATALLPIFATEVLKVGPQGMGILQSGQSLGAVVSGAGFSWIGDVKKKGRSIFYGVTIYATATVIFGASHWFVVSFLALALVGAGNTISAILRRNIQQLDTPDHLRGRMTSVIRLFSNGCHQLGDLEAGLLAALIGAPLSVVTGGIANLIFIGVLGWKVPKLRDFES